MKQIDRGTKKISTKWSTHRGLHHELPSYGRGNTQPAL
ncbi:hypothetical protein OH686_21155 [Pseudomonas sp. SO81]|nr:hypothetical protein OH686_21155 [Pseudomonas sp. SO81]